MPTSKFLSAGTSETSDLTLFPLLGGGGTGTITSDATVTKTGPRSLKCTAASADDSANATPSQVTISEAGVRGTFWWQTSNVGLGNQTQIFQVNNPSFSVLGVALDPTNKLVGSGVGVTKTTGTATISAATPVRISFALVLTSESSWTFKVWVNGVLDISMSNAINGTLTSATLQNVTFGIDTSGDLSFANSSITTYRYSDIYVDDGTDLADPGDIRVTAKRPNANGGTNGFTTQIGAGGSGYGSGHSPQVNERPLSQTNGWSTASATVTEEYNVEGLSVGDVDLTGATIVDWMGWIFAKALASVTGKIIVNNVQTSVSLTTTPTAFMAAAGSASYPPGSGHDVGMVSASSSTASLYEAGILVAYRPAVQGFVPYQPQYLMAPGMAQ